MVLFVGRHELARSRRKPPALLAAAIAPAALLFAAGADVHPPAVGTNPVVAHVAKVADTSAPVSFEVVEAASMPPVVENDGQPDTSSPPAQLVSASRWR